MLKLEKFDGTKTYMYPNSHIATPARMRKDYPAIDHFTHVLEVSGDVCQAINNLSSMRQMYNIDPALSEDDAIAALEVIINTPEPEPDPSWLPPDERIANALEDQVELARGEYLQLSEKIEALLLVASKQVDDLEFSKSEREQVGQFFELKEDPPPFGEGGKP